MCGGDNIEFTYTFDNHVFKKTFKRPDGVEYCSKCVKECPEKKIILKRHVMKDIFEENCSIMKGISNITIDRDDYISKIFKWDKEELEGKLEKLIELNIKLKELIYKKLIESEKTVYWDNITIIAPHILHSTKNKLKKRLRCMKGKEIRSYIERKFGPGSIIKLITNKRCLSFEIIKIVHENPNCEVGSIESCECCECQICFTEYSKRDLFCKTCKNQEICLECESNIRNTFKRCAFCNTEFV